MGELLKFILGYLAGKALDVMTSNTPPNGPMGGGGGGGFGDGLEHPELDPSYADR